jgi:hypothetical protein
VAVALLLCTSCLELKVNVNFRTNSAGTVEVEAVASRLARGLSWEGLSFPTTREEWTPLVAQSPGATLSSFEVIPDDLGTHTRTVLGFSTTRALESLMVSFKQKLTLLQDVAGKNNLVLAPTLPKLNTAAADTRKLWIDLWGDSEWSFTVAPPGGVAPSRFVLALRDLAAEKPPAEWKVSW